jgi:hypothetical protein
MLTQSASASHPAAAASKHEREQTAFEQPAYGGRKPTIHSPGKWYFEFTLNRKAISQISPTLVVMGVSDKQQISGTMVNVTGRETDDSPLRVGVAADLDHGKIYTSRNGGLVGWEARLQRGRRSQTGPRLLLDLHDQHGRTTATDVGQRRIRPEFW